jgi:microcystin-dependent protein
LGQKLGVELDDSTQVQVSAGTENEEKVNVEFAQRKDNHQPSLGINYIICVAGLYPMRP